MTLLNRRLVRSLCVAVLGTIALAACGSDPDPAPSAEPEQSAPPVAAPAFPRQVVHAMGTTEIPAEPTRVVVLDTGELDSAVSLGVTPVGAVTTAVDKGVLSYLQKDATGVEIVGTIPEPNLEAIAKVRPDLILSNKVRHEALYGELSQIAPTVFAEKVGVVWKDNLRLAAEALGREEMAASAISAYEEDAAALGASLTDKANLTLSPIRFVEGTIRVYSKESFIGTVLTDIGISPPTLPPGEFAAFAEISQEQLALADADRLVYASFGTAGDSGEQAVLAGALWPNLGAVKAGKAFPVDGDIYYSGIGLRAATLMLDDLREKLA